MSENNANQPVCCAGRSERRASLVERQLAVCDQERTTNRVSVVAETARSCESSGPTHVGTPGVVDVLDRASGGRVLEAAAVEDAVPDVGASCFTAAWWRAPLGGSHQPASAGRSAYEAEVVR